LSLISNASYKFRIINWTAAICEICSFFLKKHQNTLQRSPDTNSYNAEWEEEGKCGRRKGDRGRSASKDVFSLLAPDTPHKILDESLKITWNF